jgi:hypothetical protein
VGRSVIGLLVVEGGHVLQIVTRDKMSIEGTMISRSKDEE